MSVLLSVAITALIVAASLAIAAPASEAADGLAVEGGTSSRTVDLRACTPSRNAPRDPSRALATGRCPRQQGPNHASPYLFGVLTILVTNDGPPAPLEVRYLAEGRKRSIRLPGRSNLVALDAQHGSLKRLGKGRIRPLIFRFMLAPGKAPSKVDGNVELGLASSHVIVPVTGAVESFKGITVRPTSLTIPSGTESSRVVLAGADLVQFLRAGGFADPTTTLRDGGSHSTQATLELPSARHVAGRSDPNRASATVTLSDSSPHAGKYTGELTTSNLVPDAPTISVELRSHKPFVLAAVLVLVGVLIGGFLRRLVALANRRALLNRALDESLAAYECVHRGDTKSWMLDDMLGGPPFGGPTEQRLQGVPGLKASIARARSSKDLDEDSDRVLDVVARIQRWLRLEPAARRLALVSQQIPDNPVRNGRPWRSNKTWRDTQILLEAAKREPADAAAADDLVARLLRQAVWHHRYREAWTLVVPADAGRLLDLDTELATASDVETRKAADQDALDQKLAAFEVDFGAVPSPDEPEGCPGVTPVKWNASPNLFTGWATLDGPSFGQLTKRASTSARAWVGPDLGAELRAVGPRDLAWTLVALVLACVAYALLKYGDTWGTYTDMASAVLAGLLGTVVVNWAALPAFQSLRLRSSKAKG